jgi:hypothetical protein
MIFVISPQINGDIQSFAINPNHHKVFLFNSYPAVDAAP